MASIMNIKGTSQTNFFVGGPYLGFNLNTSALTLNTIWNVPNNQTGYLKNDGSGNLSWVSGSGLTVNQAMMYATFQLN